jgi:CubicO group peptidase (beta-lactamase class C family)
VKLSEYGQITSVVVSERGEIAVEEYAEGGAETLRNTRSCTKTVAGMLLGIAIDRGIVDGVDARLEDLLREPAPPVALRDLLTMSSCLDCDDWDDASPGNEELMYPQEDWLGFALGLPLRETSSFSYCTAGVVALGIALERALGEPLSDFARRELFGPLDIERAEWQHTPRGETSTAGGLELTSRSLLRLGELYLREGEGLVPRRWVAESIRIVKHQGNHNRRVLIGRWHGDYNPGINKPIVCIGLKKGKELPPFSALEGDNVFAPRIRQMAREVALAFEDVQVDQLAVEEHS